MIKSIRYFCLITFFAFSSWAYSQSAFGVFAGLNSGRLAGDMPKNASYKGLMGANVGGFFDLKLSQSLHLSFQPSYSQEGTRIFYKVAKIDEPVDSLKIRLNYFSLPLLLKVRSTNERFYALSGIEAGILADHRISSQDTELDTDLSIESFNIAMHFGAGFNIPLGYPRLFIELRYSQGLVNLTDEPVEKSYIPRVKTAGFKVFAGIAFPLNKSTE